MAFESLSERLSAAFKRLRGKGKLTEADVKEAMREVRLVLLGADVNVKVVKAFVAAVTERATGAEVLESLTPAQQVIKIVNEELVKLMGGESTKLKIASAPPTVVSHFRCSGRVPFSTIAQGKSAAMPAVIRPPAISPNVDTDIKKISVPFRRTSAS